MRLYYSKKEVHYILQFFVLLVLIFSCSLWWQEELSGFNRLMIVLSSVILLLIFAPKPSIHFNKQILLILIILLITETISIAINGIYVDLDIGNYIILITAFLFVIQVDEYEFIKLYKKIIIWICITSVCIYFVNMLFPNILSFLPTHRWYGEGRYNFYNFIICIVPQYDIYFYRNWGIFGEPGIFQLFINVALFFELFLTRHENFKFSHILIYAIALITTLSTTGYVAAIILLIAYFLKNNNFNKMKYSLIILGIVIIVVVLEYRFFPTRFQYTLDKVLNLGHTTAGSGYERIRSLQIALNTFLRDPFLGVGTINYVYSYHLQSIITTFTPLNWFVEYGIIYGVICNYYYLSLVKRVKANLVVKILISLFFFSLIVTQSMENNILIMLLIFYSILNRKCANWIE